MKVAISVANLRLLVLDLRFFSTQKSYVAPSTNFNTFLSFVSPFLAFRNIRNVIILGFYKLPHHMLFQIYHDIKYLQFPK